MKEIPILFNTEMVRAILDGRKSMTRRIVKPQPPAGSVCFGTCNGSADAKDIGKYGFGIDEKVLSLVKCPYQPGDRLWVRETWQNFLEESDDGSGDVYNNFVYYADDKDDSVKWRPSIHMPKAAARIWLEVVNVRVERLQEITAHDALKEGFPNYIEYNTDWTVKKSTPPIERFKETWNSLNAKRGYEWETNPWLWVVEFRRLEG